MSNTILSINQCMIFVLLFKHVSVISEGTRACGPVFPLNSPLVDTTYCSTTKI